MTGDLLDAQAAIEWGETELPLLIQKFHAWKEANTGVAYLYTEPGKKVAIFRQEERLPSIINAGVGSIINSFRTALDLLAAALAARNGKSPSRDTHFPIFACIHDFIDPLNGIESKKWFAEPEICVLKSLQPYDGGHRLLWPLHQLDIIRKHERLLTMGADPSRIIMVGTGVRPEFLFSGPQPVKDKTHLFELPADAAEPETSIDIQILFEERNLPAIHRKPVFGVLYEFQCAVTEIVDLFNLQGTPHA